jgi:hypothetical protein
LIVSEQGFEVGLSFKNVPERLYVPFDALMEFYDPSVQFGLKFEEMNEAAADRPAGEPAKPAIAPVPASVPALPKPRLADKAAAQTDKADKTQADKAHPEKTKPRGSGSEPAEIRPRPRAVKPEDSEPRPADSGDKIVSIDSFRKKP